MNEYEIARRIDIIESKCAQMAQGYDLAKQQGRMPTLAEAREMSELSFELLEEIRDLPQNACRLLVNTEQQYWGDKVMSLVRETLERIAQPERPIRSGINPVPRASSRKMEAYSTY